MKKKIIVFMLALIFILVPEISYARFGGSISSGGGGWYGGSRGNNLILLITVPVIVIVGILRFLLFLNSPFIKIRDIEEKKIITDLFIEFQNNYKNGTLSYIKYKISDALYMKSIKDISRLKDAGQSEYIDDIKIKLIKVDKNSPLNRRRYKISGKMADYVLSDTHHKIFSSRNDGLNPFTDIWTIDMTDKNNPIVIEVKNANYLFYE